MIQFDSIVRVLSARHRQTRWEYSEENRKFQFGTKPKSPPLYRFTTLFLPVWRRLRFFRLFLHRIWKISKLTNNLARTSIGGGLKVSKFMIAVIARSLTDFPRNLVTDRVTEFDWRTDRLFSRNWQNFPRIFGLTEWQNFRLTDWQNFTNTLTEFYPKIRADRVTEFSTDRVTELTGFYHSPKQTISLKTIRASAITFISELAEESAKNKWKHLAFITNESLAGL